MPLASWINTWTAEDLYLYRTERHRLVSLAISCGHVGIDLGQCPDFRAEQLPNLLNIEF